MNRPLSFALLCTFGISASASAHETWLSPAAFSTAAESKVAIDLTSGMEFPEMGTAIRPERVVRAHLRLASKRSELSQFEPRDKSLRLGPTLPRDGLATVWVELHPRSIELTDEQVPEYFAEIAATDEVRAAWERLKGKVVWKETYTKFAKTFIAVGDARSDRSWREPVGMGLEIVPVTDPETWHAGGEAAVELLAGGKPLRAAPVGWFAEGAKERVFGVTKADGRVTFPISHAGRVLIYAVDLRLADDGKTWTSVFTTLTVRTSAQRRDTP